MKKSTKTPTRVKLSTSHQQKRITVRPISKLRLMDQTNPSKSTMKKRPRSKPKNWRWPALIFSMGLLPHANAPVALPSGVAGATKKGHIMPVFIELNPVESEFLENKPFFINTENISTIHYHTHGSKVFEINDPDSPFIVKETPNEILAKIPRGLP